jgi:hypothetical protein
MELSPDDIRALREWKAWLRTNSQRAIEIPPVWHQPPRMVTKGRPMKLIKAPSGGIPGRVGTLLGGVICDVWKESYTTQQIEDSGGQIKVMNWTTSAVCANGDRYGIAAWINGGWYIIAEDCNDEGSTLESAIGSGTAGTISDPLDTGTLTPVSTVGQFREVRFSSTATGSGFE